jgi:hypothetical protein
MSISQSHDEPSFHFPLLWTIGFTGKRHLTDEQEKRVETSIFEALAFLREKADAQLAGLTAISSVARGGDAIFASCCLAAPSSDRKKKEPLPWKCLFPFGKEEFFSLDLGSQPSPTGAKIPLDDAERQNRLAKAEDCLAKAFRTVELVPEEGAEPDSKRVTAYQECGYRTVDESDVMIAVLRDSEFEQLKKIQATRHKEEHERLKALEKNKSTPPPSDIALINKAGSLAIVIYAIAAKRPCFVLNADDPKPWDHRLLLNDPIENKTQWFLDPNVTDVVKHALHHQAKPKKEKKPAKIKKDSHPSTDSLEKVELLMSKLGEYAAESKRSTHGGLTAVLTLHIFATAFAAIGATVIGLSEEEHHFFHEACVWILYGILVVAFLKPILAVGAYFVERRLHKKHTRESWLFSRILCELCRGASAMWPLPRQPLDAADEEDFPKVKRLLRTLRLMRENDSAAAICNMPIRGDSSQSYDKSETQSEANMRAATEYYIKNRVLDQADHYRKQQAISERQHKFWDLIFQGSLIVTIALGLGLAGYKVSKLAPKKPKLNEISASTTAKGTDPIADNAPKKQVENPNTPAHTCLKGPWIDPIKWVEFAVIIGPFLATYALGMITIRDCRRRTNRYKEMERFLHRLADTLRASSSNGSRLRLIEHTERMLIEEQHEWFSTTRNFNV